MRATCVPRMRVGTYVPKYLCMHACHMRGTHADACGTYHSPLARRSRSLAAPSSPPAPAPRAHSSAVATDAAPDEVLGDGVEGDGDGDGDGAGDGDGDGNVMATCSPEGRPH